MMNPAAIMKLMNMKSTFEKTHPKFCSFLSTAFGNDPEEGSVIEISLTRPNGKKLCTNMRITKSDLELLKQVKKLR